MKLFKKILANRKKLFCYGLIFISIMFFITIIITKPLKIQKNYIYDTGIDLVYKKLTFPIIQNLKIDYDNLSVINIYLKDTYVINEITEKYNLHVELYNKEKIYFNEKFTNYEPNIIQINLGKIPNSKDKIFTLKISCEDCQSIKIPVRKSINQNNEIEGLDNETLQILYTNYVPNNSYYWYSILGIVIGLTLLPLARGEEHE